MSTPKSGKKDISRAKALDLAHAAKAHAQHVEAKLERSEQVNRALQATLDDVARDRGHLRVLLRMVILRMFSARPRRWPLRGWVLVLSVEDLDRYREMLGEVGEKHVDDPRAAE